MKNQNFRRILERFVLDKGFYIALILCVAAIGISGYLLWDTLEAPVEEPAPVGGGAVVEVPVPKPPRPAEQPVPHPPKVEPKTEITPVPPEPKPAPEPKPDPVVYTWPVKGEVLREFTVDALAPDPTMGDWRVHRGLDIAAAAGTQVLAIGRGVVKEVYEDGLMGCCVAVEHPDGVTSICCGLSTALNVAAGDQVETGQVIGTVGNTAIAESAVDSHIHLETWREGEPIDPTFYLPLR